MGNEQNKTSKFFPGYNFDYEELIDWLRVNNYKSVAFQVPEGLKRQAINLITSIETKLGITVIFLADPCFGACDISSAKLEILDLDAIIHVGHSELPTCANNQPEIPIKYIVLQAERDLSKLIRKKNNLDVLRAEFEPPCGLGIVANVQFISQLENIIPILEKENYQIYIGTGDDRVKYPGQVLGCNFSAAKAVLENVLGFLFIGDGLFHPLGISLTTDKKVLAFDPYSDKFQDLDSIKKKILHQRNAAINVARDCNNFGILISTKPGQTRLKYADKIKAKLEQAGTKATLIALENINPSMIDYLPFDAFINTACPRLAIDDYQQYKKVIITPIELEIVLGERKWDNYIFDEII